MALVIDHQANRHILGAQWRSWPHPASSTAFAAHQALRSIVCNTGPGRRTREITGRTCEMSGGAVAAAALRVRAGGGIRSAAIQNVMSRVRFIESKTA
jgi:hypothetical protein